MSWRSSWLACLAPSIPDVSPTLSAVSVGAQSLFMAFGEAMRVASRADDGRTPPCPMLCLVTRGAAQGSLDGQARSLEPRSTRLSSLLVPGIAPISIPVAAPYRSRTRTVAWRLPEEMPQRDSHDATPSISRSRSVRALSGHRLADRVPSTRGSVHEAATPRVPLGIPSSDNGRSPLKKSVSRILSTTRQSIWIATLRSSGE